MQRKPANSYKGVVLMVTVMMLVVLAIVSVILSTSMASHRHRLKYMMDYQSSRYACDSAIKYAIDTIQDINVPDYIDRANEPDFSDIFRMDEESYNKFLDAWQLIPRNADGSEISDANDVNSPAGRDPNSRSKKTADKRIEDYNLSGLDMNDVNALSELGNLGGADKEKIEVPGPYGPPWPFIMEQKEFEIGTAKVIVTFEDENAKYPIVWPLMDDDKIYREMEYGYNNLCRWMDVNDYDTAMLFDDLAELKSFKPYKVAFQDINKSVQTSQPAPPGSANERRRSRRSRAKATNIVITQDQQASDQSKDMAILLNSGMVDLQALAVPFIDTPQRKESALKYMSLWGAKTVNVNTAPRHVLEAAFAFGGNAPAIADIVIKKRKIKPFKDFEDLRKSIFDYSDSIKKCEKYITTTSDVFTIRIKAVSGVATSTAIISVKKSGNKFEKIAVIKK